MDGVYIKALPIGIPYQRFETLSRTANRVFPNCCKIILGVDRLDYTKGDKNSIVNWYIEKSFFVVLIVAIVKLTDNLSKTIDILLQG